MVPAVLTGFLLAACSGGGGGGTAGALIATRPAFFAGQPGPIALAMTQGSQALKAMPKFAYSDTTPQCLSPGYLIDKELERFCIL